MILVSNLGGSFFFFLSTPVFFIMVSTADPSKAGPFLFLCAQRPRTWGSKTYSWKDGGEKELPRKGKLVCVDAYDINCYLLVACQPIQITRRGGGEGEVRRWDNQT